MVGIPLMNLQQSNQGTPYVSPLRWGCLVAVLPHLLSVQHLSSLAKGEELT